MSASERAPVLILVNPKSGGGLAGELVPYLARDLGQSGFPVELFQSSAPGQITRRVVAMSNENSSLSGKHSALCIVGGDGTVREALQGRPDPELPVAVLPAGTANVLAQEFRLPKRPADTARMIEQGRTRRLDAALVDRGDGDPLAVLLMIGAGIDSQIVDRVHRKRSGSTLGKLAYLGPIARSLASYRRVDHWIVLEDGSRHGPYAQVIAANVAGYGGVWRLPGAVDCNDGLFDVYGFRASGAMGLLKHGVKGALGKLVEGPELEHFQASALRIEADGPSLLQCDGDPGGACPVDLRVIPNALRLAIP